MLTKPKLPVAEQLCPCFQWEKLTSTSRSGIWDLNPAQTHSTTAARSPSGRKSTSLVSFLKRLHIFATYSLERPKTLCEDLVNVGMQKKYDQFAGFCCSDFCVVVFASV